MTAIKQNINVVRANDETLVFAHDLGSVPTFAKMCWRYGASGPIYLCKRSDETPDDFALDASSVSVSIHVEDTEALPAAPYYYDVTVIVGGETKTISYGLVYLQGGSTTFTIEKWPDMLGALVTSSQKSALDAALDLSASNPVASRNWTSGKFLRLRTGFKDVTISGGIVTVDTDGDQASFYIIHPESGTLDTLDTINGGVEGDVIILSAYSGTTITLTPNGNISLNDIVDISDKYSRILVYSNAKWRDTVGSVGYADDSDKVDGRDASAGMYPNLAWVDHLSIPISAGYEGWVTVADVSSIRANGRFIIREIGNSWLREHFVDALGGWQAQRPGALRVFVGGKYDLKGGVLAWRLVYDGNSPPNAWLQAYVVDPNDGYTRSLDVYQVTENGLSEWSLGDNGISVVGTQQISSVVGAWNGSWRLARALAGSGASIGYLDYLQMQDLFGNNPAALMDNETSTVAIGNSASATLTASGTIFVDKIKLYTNGTASGQTGVTTIETSLDGVTWVTQGTISSPYATPAWRELVFASTAQCKYIRITNNTYADVYEASVSLDATLVLRGVPTGSTVNLLDGAGTVLESVRQTAWLQDQPVMLTTDVASVAEIDITQPVGTTDWLKFPLDLGGTSTVDGGELVNGDVLALYQEN